MAIKETDYVGTDYGCGQHNQNPLTKIRFGVISANLLAGRIWDSVDEFYLPRCPSCSHEFPVDFVPSEGTECPVCHEGIEDDELYGDEPDATTLNVEGYEGQISTDNELFVTESPYYTFAQHCSQCAPGAGSLENPCRAGVKTYCLGHEFFEDGVAPYPVYRVDDNTEVSPE